MTCRHLAVDGHNLIFHLSSFAQLYGIKPRAVRQQMIAVLQRFQDCSGMKVCVAFDGEQGSNDPQLPGAIEVRYACSHQTADALIERAVSQCSNPATVAVLTTDQAERDTIESLGAVPVSPDTFLAFFEDVCGESVSTFLSHRKIFS